MICHSKKEDIIDSQYETYIRNCGFVGKATYSNVYLWLKGTQAIDIITDCSVCINPNQNQTYSTTIFALKGDGLEMFYTKSGFLSRFEAFKDGVKKGVELLIIQKWKNIL